MKKIAVILRKPPYGDINAAEAVRHAMGGAGDGLEVSLILLDGGTLLAKKGQLEEGTGLTNLGSALVDCMEMGVGVYAERASLRQEMLEERDLVDGVKVINGTEAGDLIRESGQTMIF
jgi:sulfur relay (sulfurtransferase) DsrF/TusC family protein